MTRQRRRNVPSPTESSQQQDQDVEDLQDSQAEVPPRAMPNTPVLWGRDLSWNELDMLGRFFSSSYFEAHNRWTSIPIEEQQRLQEEAYREISTYLSGLPLHPLHPWTDWLLTKEGSRSGQGPGVVPVMFPDECLARWEWAIPGASALSKSAFRQQQEAIRQRNGELPTLVTGAQPITEARHRPGQELPPGSPLPTGTQGLAGRTPGTSATPIDLTDITGSPPPAGSPLIVDPNVTEVPANIKALCTPDERNFYNALYRIPGTTGNEVAWPVERFANSYLNGGSSVAIIEWAVPRARSSSRRSTLEFLSSMAPDTQPTPRPPRSRRPVWSSKFAAPVTQTGSGDFTLKEACPHVNAEEAYRKKKGVFKFDPASEDVHARDFCAWYDNYRLYFSGLARDLANYVLMQSVDEQFTHEVLNELQDEVSIIPTSYLAQEIGRTVYQKLKINPTRVANKVRLNKDGCISQYHVYRRVADLHLCRGDSCDSAQFCISLFYAFVSHAEVESTAKARQLYYALRSSYAKLMCEIDTSIPLTATESLNSRPVPETQEDIREFVKWLLDQIVVPVAEDMAARFRRYAAEREERNPDRNNQNRVNTGNNRFKRGRDYADDTGSEPKRGNYNRISSAESKTPTKPPNDPGTPKPPVVCTHCGKPNHTEDKCWIKHPELRRERRPRRDAAEDGNQNMTDGVNRGTAPFRVGEGKEVMFDNAAPRNQGNRGRGNNNYSRGNNRGRGGYQGRGGAFNNSNRRNNDNPQASTAQISSPLPNYHSLQEDSEMGRSSASLPPKEERPSPF